MFDPANKLHFVSCRLIWNLKKDFIPAGTLAYRAFILTMTSFTFVHQREAGRNVLVGTVLDLNSCYLPSPFQHINECLLEQVFPLGRRKDISKGLGEVLGVSFWF